MALFNQRLLRSALHTFAFPADELLTAKLHMVTTWQKSLKDSNLEKTKETAIQGAFLQKFFADILDYTSQFEGASTWQLVQHPKTDIDRSEPDGALGFYDPNSQTTQVIIELKDALTALDKKQTSRKQGYTPVEQAYLYASKFADCRWFIVSNFKEIRLYHQHVGLSRYEKFSVLELSEPAVFKQFYYLLFAGNLLAREGVSVTEALLKRSSEQEKDISKQFYQDFRALREQLFDHLQTHNSHLTDPLLLLEKTQKLLDRLIFICFCEDTPGLLPPDVLRNTFARAKQSFSSSETRIWDEFRGLFQAVDQGNTRVIPPINAYDGGLFEYGPVLDTLTIHDDIFAPLMTLAGYDFESNLNVNILGHIFE